MLKKMLQVCVVSVLATIFLASGSSLAADKITVKVAVNAGEEDPMGVAAIYFQKRIAELTDNTVEAKLFMRGVLGSEEAALENTIAGNIDFDIVSNTVMTTLVPASSILDLPYGLSSLEHAWRVLDGPLGQYINEEARDKGIRVLGWAFAGSRCLIFNSKPIKNLADLKGLKVRVPANPVYSQTIKAWGANPTTIPWNEVYLALSQGVADGTETAPGPSFDKKHFEVAKYLIRTNHLFYFHVWVASEKNWKKFPKEIQMAMSVAGHEAAMVQRAARIKQEINIYDEFAAKGMTIIDPEKAQFIEKSRSVYDEFKDKATPMQIKLIRTYEK
jgi:tripartite ATP-independent transporter DctP family solute receptor